ncbi:MAG: hypothetical protein Q8N46_05070 [Anaerolineales bacterium]|nr:hypothetical protein [Anaerolineales bacterium]
MGRREPLITPGNLKANIYKNSFSNSPHKFYVVYDDLMNEFMIRLNKPEELVAKFPVSDTLSLLVDPSTLEVMGFQLSEFTSEYLPHFHSLNKTWYSKKLAQCFSKYHELYYDPQQLKQPEQKKKNIGDNYYFVPYKIDSVLATC